MLTAYSTFISPYREIDLEATLQEELRWTAAISSRRRPGDWYLLDLVSLYGRREQSEIYKVRIKSLHRMSPSRAYLEDLTVHGSELAPFDSVQVEVHHAEEMVRFGPRGNILFHQQGEGFGSYIFSLVIRWVKARYPKYRVCAGSLSFADAKGGNLPRRNAFYRNFGFVVRCNSVGDGTFSVGQVADLHEHLPGDRLCQPHDPRIRWFLQRCLDARKRAMQNKRGLRYHAREWNRYFNAYYDLRKRVIVGIVFVGVAMWILLANFHVHIEW